MTAPLEVAAAVLLQNSTILACRRASAEDLAGQWEFPGGKREAGETLAECLQREIEEELGLSITVAAEVCSTLHHYPDRSINLTAFWVHQWLGTIRLSVHDSFRWLSADELQSVQWSAADRQLLPLVHKQLAVL